MAEPINLNRARKASARAQAKVQAAQNRASFGRTRAERSAAASAQEQAAERLEAHRRERDAD